MPRLRLLPPGTGDTARRSLGAVANAVLIAVAAMVVPAWTPEATAATHRDASTGDQDGKRALNGAGRRTMPSARTPRAAQPRTRAQEAVGARRAETQRSARAREAAPSTPTAPPRAGAPSVTGAGRDVQPTGSGDAVTPDGVTHVLRHPTVPRGKASGPRSAANDDAARKRAGASPERPSRASPLTFDVETDEGVSQRVGRPAESGAAGTSESSGSSDSTTAAGGTKRRAARRGSGARLVPQVLPPAMNARGARRRPGS